jgi:hypothetical protein
VLTVRIKRISSAALTTTSTANQALELNNSMLLSAELKKLSGQILWADPRIVVDKSSAGTRGALVASTADFSSTGLTQNDIQGFNDRENARLFQQSALLSMVDRAARLIYEQAVAPDF